MMKKTLAVGTELLGVSFAVFLLYQMMWYMIYNDPSVYFSSPHFVTDRIKDSGLVVVFCGVSLLFAHLSVWLARKMNVISAKMLLLSAGLLTFNVVWSYAFTAFLNRLFRVEGGFADPVGTYGLAISSTLVVSLLFTARYVRAFVKEEKLRNEEERLRNQEKLMARDVTIENLQLQLSPHFLFNNLSALSALIDDDKQKANDFLLHLSQYYRNTLLNMSCKLIPVHAELDELEDYLFLLRTRFGDSVNIQIVNDCDYAVDYHPGLIPPGIIQLLVENSITHNRFSKREPMRIEIRCGTDTVTVTNDYRPIRHDDTSTKIGQENIRQRYRLLEHPDVVMRHDDKHYIVTIPLILAYQENEHSDTRR